MPFDDEQTRNANTIISVGRSLGASDRDIQTALAAAIVESGLRNVSYGDRDSVGLFQQRAPWGSFDQRMNPSKAARMFFTGGETGQPGLFDKHGRDQMSPGRAAQAVQVSAYPDRYDQHAQEALSLLSGTQGAPTSPGGSGSTPTPAGAPKAPVTSVPGGLVDPGPQDPGMDTPDYQAPTRVQLAGDQPAPVDALDLSTLDRASFTDMLGGMKLPGVFAHNDVAPVAATGGRKKAVDFALGGLGVPYAWGGQSKTTGWDCSGFTMSALAAAGIDIPRVSFAQANSGARVGLDKLKPGDLVGWDNSARNNSADHIALYIGGGEIVEAPRPGVATRRRKIGSDEGAWGVDMSRSYGG